MTCALQTSPTRQDLEMMKPLVIGLPVSSDALHGFGAGDPGAADEEGQKRL